MSSIESGPLPAEAVIDAYMHVGSPRFGTARQALEACARWGTAGAVLVLGPRVPDLAALAEAQRLSPERIRAVGIPYGATVEQRMVCAEACLEVGAIGLRLQGDEPLENPAIMALLGESGSWAYATDPLASARHTALLLDWLARYPSARIAAPHFVSPRLTRLDEPLAEQLVRHPRFYAILSRQGQVGSREPYPWADLLPWVQRVQAWCGPERMLWGSEYPVIYWRGEQIDQTRRWVQDLGLDISEADYAAFVGGNARRLFFDGPPPLMQEPTLPDWLRHYSPPGPVALAPTGPITLPIDLYEALFDDYAALNRPEQPMSFADYCVQRLRESVEARGRHPRQGETA